MGKKGQQLWTWSDEGGGTLKMQVRGLMSAAPNLNGDYSSEALAADLVRQGLATDLFPHKCATAGSGRTQPSSPLNSSCPHFYAPPRLCCLTTYKLQSFTPNIHGFKAAANVGVIDQPARVFIIPLGKKRINSE